MQRPYVEKYLAEILATVSIQAMIWPPKVFPWWFAWGGWTSSILCTWVRSVETASSSSNESEIQQQCIDEVFQLVTLIAKKKIPPVTEMCNLLQTQWKEEKKKDTEDLCSLQGKQEAEYLLCSSKRCKRWGMGHPAVYQSTVIFPSPHYILQRSCVRSSYCESWLAVNAGSQLPQHVLVIIHGCYASSLTDVVRAVYHLLQCCS